MPAVQHIVLFRFKPEITPARIAELFREVEQLKSLIPGIRYFAGGPNSSPEGFNQGYTHGFLMTFENAAARDAYLPHPEHENVKAALLASIEAGLAFDIDVPPTLGA